MHVRLGECSLAIQSKEFYALCNEGYFPGPASDQEIQVAEATLGVNFPRDYLDVLKTYGAVVADGFAIYGLPDPEKNDPPLWQNVVLVTKKLRESKQIGAEVGSLIAISDNGFGGYVFLDTFSQDEYRILVMGPDISRVYDMSLFDFCLEVASGRLEI